MSDLFSLSRRFVDSYRTIKPPFGFNGLGEFVYMRTYSRIKSNGAQESWVDTVERVVNGTMRLIQRHAQKTQLTEGLPIEKWAERMFDKIFHMKFLPPGRGLWAMGTAITEEKQLYAALQNCAFVTTENIDKDPVAPFAFLMDASMLGVGVGFDTRGTGKTLVHRPTSFRRFYQIPDTREGWVESVRLLLHSYFVPYQMAMRFDYSLIRPAGTIIKTFGGISSGHEALQEIHEQIRQVLDRNAGSPITTTTIVDIMNLIGKCVVSGNVRRTAEIAFGEPTDEYLNLKN
jgi:ribonucleoside-triphosphate reductase